MLPPSGEASTSSLSPNTKGRSLAKGGKTGVERGSEAFTVVEFRTCPKSL
jgi:hypothetical protein